jgi:glucan phosphoethanolaminetransferase (alkaline phosphatase superfamily)
MRPLQKWCLLAIGIAYCAPIVTMMWWAAGSQRLRGVLSIALVAILLAFVVAAATRTWRRFFLAQLPLSLLAVGFVCYTLAYHMPPGRTLALLVLMTSREEVRGFLLLPQGALLVALLSAWCIGYWFLAAPLRDVRIFVGPVLRWSRAILVLLLPLTAYAALDPAQLVDGIALNPMAGSLIFIGGRLAQESRELNGSLVSKTPYGAHRDGPEEVHIFVLGESARRDSWSAFGYRRPTTPFVDTLKGEAIFLQHARTDANLTELAVPILLTGLRPDQYALEKIHGNFFDLAHEAGYSTTWLVNNSPEISDMIGIHADRRALPPDLNGNINGRHTLDEALLGAYRSELARGGKARFIGLHIMGSHWEYYARYPKAFQKFGEQSQLDQVSMVSVLMNDPKVESELVDEYDNSLLYTDWILQQIIEQARTLKVPATVTFLSDHGESLQLLDGTAGHGAPVYSPHEFEIPAFVWVNDAYRSMHPEIMRDLQANAHKLIRSHNLFDSLAQLMGIRWPGADPHQSFVSSQFVPDTHMPYLAGGVQVAGDDNVATR